MSQFGIKHQSNLDPSSFDYNLNLLALLQTADDDLFLATSPTPDSLTVASAINHDSEMQSKSLLTPVATVRTALNQPHGPHDVDQRPGLHADGGFDPNTNRHQMVDPRTPQAKHSVSQPQQLHPAAFVPLSFPKIEIGSGCYNGDQNNLFQQQHQFPTTSSTNFQAQVPKSNPSVPSTSPPQPLPSLTIPPQQSNLHRQLEQVKNLQPVGFGAPRQMNDPFSKTKSHQMMDPFGTKKQDTLTRDPIIIPGVGIVDVSQYEQKNADSLLYCTVYFPSLPRMADQEVMFTQIRLPVDQTIKQLIWGAKQQFHDDLVRLRAFTPGLVDSALATHIQTNVLERKRKLLLAQNDQMTIFSDPRFHVNQHHQQASMYNNSTSTDGWKPNQISTHATLQHLAQPQPQPLMINQSSNINHYEPPTLVADPNLQIVYSRPHEYNPLLYTQKFEQDFSALTQAHADLEEQREDNNRQNDCILHGHAQADLLLTHGAVQNNSNIEAPQHQNVNYASFRANNNLTVNTTSAATTAHNSSSSPTHTSVPNPTLRPSNANTNFQTPTQNNSIAVSQTSGGSGGGGYPPNPSSLRKRQPMPGLAVHPNLPPTPTSLSHSLHSTLTHSTSNLSSSTISHPDSSGYNKGAADLTRTLPGPPQQYRDQHFNQNNQDTIRRYTISGGSQHNTNNDHLDHDLDPRSFYPQNHSLLTPGQHPNFHDNNNFDFEGASPEDNTLSQSGQNHRHTHNRNHSQQQYTNTMVLPNQHPLIPSSSFGGTGRDSGFGTSLPKRPTPSHSGSQLLSINKINTPLGSGGGGSTPSQMASSPPAPFQNTSGGNLTRSPKHSISGNNQVGNNNNSNAPHSPLSLRVGRFSIQNLNGPVDSACNNHPSPRHGISNDNNPPSHQPQHSSLHHSSGNALSSSGAQIYTSNSVLQPLSQSFPFQDRCPLDPSFLIEDVFGDEIDPQFQYQLCVWDEEKQDVDNNYPPLLEFTKLTHISHESFALISTLTTVSTHQRQTEDVDKYGRRKLMGVSPLEVLRGVGDGNGGANSNDVDGDNSNGGVYINPTLLALGGGGGGVDGSRRRRTIANSQNANTDNSNKTTIRDADNNEIPINPRLLQHTGGRNNARYGAQPTIQMAQQLGPGLTAADISFSSTSLPHELSKSDSNLAGFTNTGGSDSAIAGINPALLKMEGNRRNNPISLRVNDVDDNDDPFADLPQRTENRYAPTTLIPMSGSLSSSPSTDYGFANTTKGNNRQSDVIKQGLGDSDEENLFVQTTATTTAKKQGTQTTKPYKKNPNIDLSISGESSPQPNQQQRKIHVGKRVKDPPTSQSAVTPPLPSTKQQAPPKRSLFQRFFSCFSADNTSSFLDEGLGYQDGDNNPTSPKLNSSHETHQQRQQHWKQNQSQGDNINYPETAPNRDPFETDDSDADIYVPDQNQMHLEIVSIQQQQQQQFQQLGLNKNLSNQSSSGIVQRPSLSQSIDNQAPNNHVQHNNSYHHNQSVSTFQSDHSRLSHPSQSHQNQTVGSHIGSTTSSTLQRQSNLSQFDNDYENSTSQSDIELNDLEFQ